MSYVFIQERPLMHTVKNLLKIFVTTFTPPCAAGTGSPSVRTYDMINLLLSFLISAPSHSATQKKVCGISLAADEC